MNDQLIEGTRAKSLDSQTKPLVKMTRWDKSDFMAYNGEDLIQALDGLGDSHYKAVYERNYVDGEIKTEYLAWKTKVDVRYSKGWAITKHLREPVFKDQPFLIDCKVYETARFSVDFDTVDQAKTFREKAKRFLEKTIGKELGQYPKSDCVDRENEFRRALNVLEAL